MSKFSNAFTRLIAVLAGVALFGGLLSGASAPASASPTFPPPGLINLSQLQLPSEVCATFACTQMIFYPEGIYSATPAQITSIENVENTAISDTIADHSLSSADANTVLSWGRADADAELWALITQAIQAVKATTATTDQTNVVEWLTAVSTRQGVITARDAGLEYTKWAGLGIQAYGNLLNTNPTESQLQTFLEGQPQPYTDGGDGASTADAAKSVDGGYCVYQSPTADKSDSYIDNIFSTNVSANPNATCFGPCRDLLTNCVLSPPSASDFSQWGEADADDTLFNNTGYATAAGNIALGASLAALGTAGAVGAGIGTTFALGSVLGGTAFQTAVFPFAARASQITIDAAVDAAEAAGESAVEATQGVLDAAAEVGADVAASGVGVIVAAVIFAILAAVQEGLTVFTTDASADQLAQNIANAPTNTPDLTSMLTDSNKMQGLFSLFVGSTLPAPTFTDCDNSPSGGIVISGGADPTAKAPCLNATDIPAPTSYDPQWIVTPQGSTTSTVQSTLDWNDAATTLDTTSYLHGNWLVNTATVLGTTSTVQSLRLRYTDWSGNENTAWVFSSADPPEFLTISDSALGSSFDPSTCLTAATPTCALSQTIDVVGADGHNYQVGIQAGVEAPPIPVVPPCVPTSQIICGGPPETSFTTMSGPTEVEVNEPTTFTATISSISTGAVDFSNGSTDLCPSAAVQGVTTTTTTNSGGIIITTFSTVYQATCTVTFAKTGKVFLFGTYSGDDLNAPSQGELTANVVNKAETTTGVGASDLAPVVGEPVTYTATVSDPGGPAPTGSVTFTNGGSTVCSTVALTASSPYTARCSQTYAAPSSGQTVVATYAEDAQTLGSHGQATVVVGQASSQTSVSPSTAVPVVGQPVTYTATVSPLAPDTAGPGLTGSVTFTNGAVTVCSAVPLATTPPYTATCSQTYAAPAAGQTVKATYIGDPNIIGSNGQTTVVVGKASSQTMVSPSTAVPVVGQPVTYTATVSPLAPDTAGPGLTGSVTFTNGAATVCSAVLISASSPYTATCSQTYAAPSAGQTVTATYSGDSNTKGSNNQTTVVVSKASTSTSLMATPPSTSFGQPVVLHAMVTAVAPSTAGPTPTGTAAFTVDGQPLGTVALANGAATSPTIYDLAPGQHTVAVTYSGDNNYKGSQGSTSETVTCSQTITTSMSGTVTVSGSTCIKGGTINGQIKVAAGGTLALIGAHVVGSITTSGAGGVLLCGSSVTGGVTLTGSTRPVMVGGTAASGCGADSVGGTLTVAGSTAPVTIVGVTTGGGMSLTGNAGVSVTGSTVGGTLTVTGNTGSVTVTSNKTSGPTTVSSNTTTSAPVVSGNTIGGGLSCTSNSPAPTNLGVANSTKGSANGQCAKLN